ncbi:MAG: hypothetical protein ABFR33_02815 [Verrucomicrobiota bacterium]
MKRKIKKKQGITKGMPSAVLLSIAIHAALFFLAGMLVIFTVVKKKEIEFEPPKAVERPKMKLKKPKPRIKKSARPKKATHILAKVNPVNMPEIQLPELGGMGGDGFGGGIAGGFDTLPDLGEVSVFGSGQSIGNDFEGTLYDLKRDRQGRDLNLADDQFMNTVRKFLRSGWNPAKLGRYYRSPKKLYTTHFMIPLTPTSIATDAYGEPGMSGYHFMLIYKGQLVCPPSYPNGITFRFWGIGDAYAAVRVGDKDVFVAGWESHRNNYFNWWQSNSGRTLTYFLGNQKMIVGDWITLEPNKPVEMQVLFGEYKGGTFTLMLNVEVQGEEYERNRQAGPILPAFKTADFTRDQLDTIHVNLPEGESCLTNGPVFCDYAMPDRAKEVEGIEPPVSEPEPSGDTGPRTWTLINGRTFEAEFVTLLGSKVCLRNPKGKILKFPKDELSAEDLEYIQLETPPDFDISLSKQSNQRIFPPRHNDMLKYAPPQSAYWTFSANVKQTSPGSYNHVLQAELFVIGTEVKGDKYVLLDYQKNRWIPSGEHDRSARFSGRKVELVKYLVGHSTVGFEYKGWKYSSYLVVITDKRGKIIAHETPKKWLFENLENLEKLRKLSAGQYFDKTFTRTGPTRPRSLFY